MLHIKLSFWPFNSCRFLSFHSPKFSSGNTEFCSLHPPQTVLFPLPGFFSSDRVYPSSPWAKLVLATSQPAPWSSRHEEKEQQLKWTCCDVGWVVTKRITLTENEWASDMFRFSRRWTVGGFVCLSDGVCLWRDGESTGSRWMQCSFGVGCKAYRSAHATGANTSSHEGLSLSIVRCQPPPWTEPFFWSLSQSTGSVTYPAGMSLPSAPWAHTLVSKSLWEEILLGGFVFAQMPAGFLNWFVHSCFMLMCWSQQIGINLQHTWVLHVEKLYVEAELQLM